jgi:paraquat-inducible protein B
MNQEQFDDPAAPGEPRIVRRRDWLPSLVWLIPIVAALVGITLVAKILWDRGPEIVLTFETAQGLDAGKTTVRYKDVQIGIVKTISLAQDRDHVRLVVQLNKEAQGFTAADTRYWVVRPRLDTTGISGLNTLFSGPYIGADAGVSTDTSHEFTGLEVPPIITRGAEGRQFVLHARDIGSLDFGSPVYFRRIRVGQVVSYDLDPNGRSVTLRVFVNAPYDKYIGINTRFWHASGVDLQLSASGLTLRTQSLATIVLGGIAFDAPDGSAGAQVQGDSPFLLADDEGSAMKPPDGPPQDVLMYFDQSIRGLSLGAAVEFRGIVIGEVKSIGVQFDRDSHQILMPVTATIYPDRLRRVEGSLAAPEDSQERQRRVQQLLDLGLRAQLRTGSLLTGQLFVALDVFPKEKPARIDTAKNPWVIPTVPNRLDELQTQVQEIAAKINKIPFDQLAGDMRKTLAALDKTLGATETALRGIDKQVTPEVAAALKDARQTLNSAQRALDDNSPLQQDARETLQQLTRAAASITVLADYLERHPESLLRGKPEQKK